ncbi:MAG TPA: TolC family protein [Puia sp.]|jgi:outer membrane protein TolC|nr:TolC family protein [Puia sp.]
MKHLLFIALMFCSIAIYAQVPTNPNSAYRLNSDTGRMGDVRERLVQLALQNPLYEIADHNVTIAEYNIRLAKTSWLSSITVAGNLNEFSIDPKAAGNASVYYPRYNFGITIPLDIFAKSSNNTKIAYEKYMVAQSERNDRFRTIKADILTRYEDYLLAQEKLTFQYKITKDAFEAYSKAEIDFKNNLIKIEDLNLFNSKYVDEQIKRLELQRNYNVSKIDIERLIGVKLEDVIQLVEKY